MKKFIIISLVLNCSIFLQASNNQQAKPTLTIHTYNSDRDKNEIEAIIAQNYAGTTGLDINGIEKNEARLREKYNNLPQANQIFNSLLIDGLMQHMHKTTTKVLRINDTKTIGFLTYSLIDNDSTVNIDQLAIDKNYQRKHYGKDLLETHIKNLKKKHTNIKEICLAVNHNNQPARLFYNHIGFRQDAPQIDLVIPLSKKVSSR
jgi:ribosomal protein S18 acetylase RimI-like enzyme